MYDPRDKPPIKATLGAIILVGLAITFYLTDGYEYRSKPFAASVAKTDTTPPTSSSGDAAGITTNTAEEHVQTGNHTLGLSIIQYGAEINKLVADTNVYRDDWDDIAKQASLSQSFNATYTSGLMISGVIDDNGTLTEIAYKKPATTNGKQEDLSFIELAVNMGRVLSPNASVKLLSSDIKRIIDQAAISYAYDKSPKLDEVVIGDIRYTFEIEEGEMRFRAAPYQG